MTDETAASRHARRRRKTKAWRKPRTPRLSLAMWNTSSRSVATRRMSASSCNSRSSAAVCPLFSAPRPEGGKVLPRGSPGVGAREFTWPDGV